MAVEEFVDCMRCGGNGQHVECYDDLCHAQGECMHGDNTCNLCEGHGRISTELATRWRRRDTFESVTLPGADRKLRGLDRKDRADVPVDSLAWVLVATTVATALILIATVIV